MSNKTARERFEKARAELEAFADQLDEKGTAPSAEDLQELTRRTVELKELYDQMKTAKAARDVLTDSAYSIASLGEAPDGVVKSLADVAPPVAGMRATGKTLGELFTDSASYGEFGSKYKGRDGVIPSSTKGINSMPFQSGVDLKALITGADSTSAGAFVQNDRYPTVTDLIGERPLSVADLVTKGSTLSDTVEYVRVTSKTNAAAPVAEATTDAAGAISGASPGPYVVAAASGAKPQSILALEVVSTTVKTIAHWMALTKRAASDAGQVRTLVDSFLRYGLFEELEDQIVSGSGAGENFTGILNTAGIQTVGSAGTDLDAIVDAMKAIQVTGRRRANAIVINPDDWFSTGFLLAKDTAGNYLLDGPKSSPYAGAIWGLQVVVSEAIAANTALVGDFRQAVLWEREGITLSITDSHADFFVRNLLAILAEMRAAFGVLDPQAFCTVTAI